MTRPAGESYALTHARRGASRCLLFRGAAIPRSILFVQFLVVIFLAFSFDAHGAPATGKTAKEEPDSVSSHRNTAVAAVPSGTNRLLKTDTTIYWYNEVTSETSKTDPTRAVKGITDPQHNRTYWLDPVTNLATWERPEAFAWDEVPSKEDPTRKYYWNAVSGTTTWEKPAVLAWKTAEYGFWYNTVTGESVTDSPPELGYLDPVQKRTYWIDPDTKKAVWAAPEQWSWTESESKDPAHEGRSTFYSNTVTGKSTWEKPASLAWARKSRTKMYYYNQLTGESTYERPKQLGYEDPATNKVYYDITNSSAGKATGEVTWDPPHYAAGAWHETESPAGTANPGKVFYHNSVTGEVQWAKPEVTAWIKYHEDL
uniref:WW domain-containing protein n=1 Tax=Mantoniella antarctica TaxID=81844 RepID=A0A7S0SKA1_9CHLO|mmetsp:Transcript_28161/g.70694  ORF Transcript_28161/g.70694 Transcript_28161/m.70694 type:complete len:370 (+) Transcript_28161:58-1167(+)